LADPEPSLLALRFARLFVWLFFWSHHRFIVLIARTGKSSEDNKEASAIVSFDSDAAFPAMQNVTILQSYVDMLNSLPENLGLAGAADKCANAQAAAGIVTSLETFQDGPPVVFLRQSISALIELEKTAIPPEFLKSGQFSSLTPQSYATSIMFCLIFIFGAHSLFSM
jgi:hypothetical protein